MCSETNETGTAHIALTPLFPNALIVSSVYGFNHSTGPTLDWYAKTCLYPSHPIFFNSFVMEFHALFHFVFIRITAFGNVRGWHAVCGKKTTGLSGASLNASDSNVFLINLAILETYPGRLYQDGMTVCCKTPALKIGSSLKIFSNNLNELPLVLIENCGYNGKTTKRVILSLLMFSIASSVNGFQYRMPTYVFTCVNPFDTKDFFNASDCSSVIRRNGDPPPMDS